MVYRYLKVLTLICLCIAMTGAGTAKGMKQRLIVSLFPETIEQDDPANLAQNLRPYQTTWSLGYVAFEKTI